MNINKVYNTNHYCFIILRLEPKVLHVVGQHSTTDPHLGLLYFFRRVHFLSCCLTCVCGVNTRQSIADAGLRPLQGTLLVLILCSPELDRVFLFSLSSTLPFFMPFSLQSF